MGSGGGFLDYDNDGWQDIYLVQSGPIPDTPGEPLPNRLFHNQGSGRFADVTAGSGAGDTGYGIGASFGDVDSDGFIDLFVTNFGPDQLYRNNGDGTFKRITDKAGVGDERWGASSAFADYDLDGDLDLYVVNYLVYSPKGSSKTFVKGIQTYCDPDAYPGSPDILYRNDGGAVFADVTKKAGVYNDDPKEGKGLGIVWCDYDMDGDPDIYVANDGTANFLYRNEGNGRFADVTLTSGAGYNGAGQTEAGMGVACGDYNWDGYPDLFVSNLSGETNTLYHNTGKGTFKDYTARSQLGVPSLPYVGFGTGFIDFDNDGWLDLFVANGHILDAVERIYPGSGLTYAEPNLFFENDRKGSFREVSAQAGERFRQPRVSRGAAFGDIDNDGDLDILVTNSNQQAVLLRNQVGDRNDWIGFRLKSRSRNRDAVGARVEMKVNGQVRWREVQSGSSYLSQHDLRLVFGLGRGERPTAVAIRWPDGRRQELELSALRWNTYNDIEDSAMR